MRKAVKSTLAVTTALLLIGFIAVYTLTSSSRPPWLPNTFDNNYRLLLASSVFNVSPLSFYPFETIDGAPIREDDIVKNIIGRFKTLEVSDGFSVYLLSIGVNPFDDWIARFVIVEDFAAVSVKGGKPEVVGRTVVVHKGGPPPGTPANIKATDGSPAQGRPQESLPASAPAGLQRTVDEIKSGGIAVPSPSPEKGGRSSPVVKVVRAVQDLPREVASEVVRGGFKTVDVTITKSAYRNVFDSWAESRFVDATSSFMADLYLGNIKYVSR